MKTDEGKISARRRAEWLEDGDHDINLVSLLAQQNLKRLDNNISDIEHEMTRAEKLVNDEKVQNKEQFRTVFNRTIEKLEQKLDNIASKLTESQCTHHPQPVKRKHSQEIGDVPSTSKIQVISDEEYMERLIEENRDDQDAPPEDAERREKQHQEQEQERRAAERRERQQQEQEQERQDRARHEEERRRYIAELEDELAELRDSYSLLSRRKFGYSDNVKEWTKCSFCGAIAQHYSDSCPEITTGQERYNFIEENGMCRICLGRGHKAAECRTEEKDCWYCNTVRGRALYFLVEEQEHHRALCVIPDSKDRIRARIRRVEEELYRVRHQ
ncbi:hypothetical protein TELCIR_18663 [Teladorsagia circumcincta]|uniref:CCHC-type domain-containing protein n=1 Tax=Teladorsagia circumcincta TaxID=45464 RepID=A0A2G9TPG3_TELCI|nr:hypothetical protein TELCIR_18663 [Teladorsagia circumcincta]